MKKLMSSIEAETWAHKLYEDPEIRSLFLATRGQGEGPDILEKSEELIRKIQNKLPDPYNANSMTACKIVLQLIRLKTP